MEERLKVFLSELKLMKEEILSIHQKIKNKKEEFKKEPENENIKESLAYKLHNLYCAYEDLFKLVANFFENQIESTSKYHINLLKRMLVEIEDLRPALLSKETYKILDELRGFRHLFRHAYSYELDGERVLKLAEKMELLENLFNKDFNKFVENLKLFMERGDSHGKSGN